MMDRAFLRELLPPLGVSVLWYHIWEDIGRSIGWVLVYRLRLKATGESPQSLALPGQMGFAKLFSIPPMHIKASLKQVTKLFRFFYFFIFTISTHLVLFTSFKDKPGCWLLIRTSHAPLWKFWNCFSVINRKRHFFSLKSHFSQTMIMIISFASIPGMQQYFHATKALLLHSLW